MIDHYTKISPFVCADMSGDFSLVVDEAEFSLIAVGDIGGHGNSNIYNIATYIQELITQNSQKTQRLL